MTQGNGSELKLSTILKWVGGILLVIVAITMWNMPSRRGGGTVGERAMGKALGVGVLMIPVMAVGYLLSRRKGKDKDGDPGNNPPAPRGE